MDRGVSDSPEIVSRDRGAKMAKCLGPTPTVGMMSPNEGATTGSYLPLNRLARDATL